MEVLFLVYLEILNKLKSSIYKEWTTKNKIGKIHLITINIEVDEYELLNRLIEFDLIKEIDNIQVQFHNLSKKSQSEMDKIQSKLEKTYQLTFQYKFVWENWTRKK